MFRFSEDISPELRRAEALRFKTDIEALPAVIPCIRAISVGLNLNPDEEWDICLQSTFDNLDDVRTYSRHPAHVAVGSRLKTYVSGRACVDYED